MNTPNITQAQVLSKLTALASLLLTQGLISNHTEKILTGIASILLPLGWDIADAIIRHGRAKVAAAQATAAASAASAKAWDLATQAQQPKPAPRSRSKAASK